MCKDQKSSARDLNLSVEQLHGPIRDFLTEIYVVSEFLDPVDDILQRCEENGSSLPLVVKDGNSIAAFFLIESTNYQVTGRDVEEGVYWLESFFLTSKYLGKGYAVAVVRQVLQELPRILQQLRSLYLTVNLRNSVAQRVYQQCGFHPTGQQYLAGPAGPQWIYRFDFVGK